MTLPYEPASSAQTLERVRASQCHLRFGVFSIGQFRILTVGLDLT